MISRNDAVAKYFISEFSTVSDEEYANLIRLSINFHRGMNKRTELKSVEESAPYSLFDEMILYHAAHDYVAIRDNLVGGETQSQRVDNISTTQYPSSHKPEEQEYKKTKYGVLYIRIFRTLVRTT